MLRGNDILFAQFVQRGQVLLVHDLLFDTDVAIDRFVRGLEP